MLGTLTDIAPFQRVTLVAKAIRVGEVEEVAGGKKSRISLLEMALGLPGLPYGRVKLGKSERARVTG